MDVDFAIPLSKDDLLSGEPGSYVVDEVLSVRVLPNILKGCICDIRSGVPFAITENFDCFFSLIRHFNEVDNVLTESTWDGLLQVLCQFTNALSPVLEDGDIDFETRRTHLNTLKMLCYLLTQLVEAFEAEATKPSTEVVTSGKRKTKSVVSRKKSAASHWEWDEQRNLLIQALGHVMQLDVNRLWDPPTVEEEFVNLITGCCYKLLENPSSVRNGATKDLIFNLMGVMVKKYNYGLGVSLKIVQLLQHFEHLVQPMAQAVETFVNEFGVKSIVSEIMREIGRMDPRDLARDTSGTRSYSDFLVELASRVPSQIIPNFSVLLCHLNGESYVMRNGILGLMGEIIVKVLCKDDLDDAGRKLRDQLLDKMEEHIHDVNAYVRSKALHIWLQLCKEKAIPISRQPNLLGLVIGRLQDKSSIVRKNAIQLLKTFLICNPFGAQLPLEHLLQNLRKEITKLKEMTTKFSDEQEQDLDDQVFHSPGDDAGEAVQLTELDAKALLQVSIEHENSENSSSKAHCGLVNEVTKQQVVVQFLEDYVHFQTQMEKAIPTVCQLLGSKTVSDVNEAIEFIVVASEFGLQSAIVGVRRMLVLIWSRDLVVREAVVEAYKGLYLEPVAPNARAKTAAIVKNLIDLTQGASIGDLTSLEELMSNLMKGKLIPAAVVKLLWEKFTMKVAQTTPEESRAALVLLGMLAGAEMDIVHSNIEVLVATGLGPRAADDFLLARDTCVALLKLVNTHRKPGVKAEEPFRLPSSHVLFQRLTEILVSGVRTLDKPDWTPMMEQAINVIYFLSEHPEASAENIIKRIGVCLLDKPDDQFTESTDKDTGSALAEGMSSNSQVTCHSGILARFLSLSGHVALRHLVHLDVGVQGEIKRRQAIEESEKENAKQAQKTRKNGDQSSASCTKDARSSETIEEELGLAGATADDVEAEYIRRICEHEIVSGGTLLSSLRPLLVCVCSNPTKYSDPKLRASSSLALAKFMLVSSEFCEAHLQLLFTILEKAPQPTIRANTIVAVGDLSFRFPNLIEPWTPHLYARLRDESSHVRKNTLMVLTHLILNDMVKVKGQISEMATCLEDKDSRISDLAKLFFLELSKKGNAIYNILPDVISRLSDPDCGTDEDSFRNIMRYLLSFIQKDRQSESLVEKLCHRFRATKTERQWRDLAFCLSMLSYNERGIRKLQENFACFHDKLAEEDVFHSFLTVVGKTKKFAKPEIKAMVDELEQRINQCHTKGVEDEEDYNRASKASDVVTKKNKSDATPRGKTTRNRKGRTPGAKKSGRKTVDESDSEDSFDSFRSPRNPKRLPRTGKTKSSNKKRRPMPSFESDEDDGIELFNLNEEKETGIDSGEQGPGEENINPNISNRGISKTNTLQTEGNDFQDTRKVNRPRLISS